MPVSEACLSPPESATFEKDLKHDQDPRTPSTFHASLVVDVHTDHHGYDETDVEQPKHNEAKRLTPDLLRN